MTAQPDLSKRSLMRGTWLVSSTVATVTSPTRFLLWDREWDIMPGVFAPTQCVSTEFFTDTIPFPVGGAFLEVGCGAGITAVRAAESGCAHVVATDISEMAIENARMNARRHGIADLIRFCVADVFDGVDPDERFDVVYWNSPFLDPGAPSETAAADVRSMLRQAVFDPGYKLHARFISGARERLRPGGRLLLGFSDLGNWAALTALAEREGFRPAVLSDSGNRVVGIRYQLLELVPADVGGPA